MASSMDIFKGKWNQIKGEMKQWWGKLTDDDVATINGSKDKLIGLLQQRYGYDRLRAEQEIEQRLRGFC